MHCTKCSYPLWDISARTCPECGHGFNPADYEFVPGAVRFCCPNCDHAYYGTEESGQMKPAEFACAGCKAPMSASIAVVRLKPGGPEPSVTCPDMPWLNRARHGFWRAWWKTLKLSITSPRILMRRTPPESSWVQAVWYAIFCIFLAMALGYARSVLMEIIPWGGIDSLRSGAYILDVALFQTGWVMLTSGALVVVFLVWTATAHATLRVTGNVRGPIRRTVHALCYSMGLFLVAFVVEEACSVATSLMAIGFQVWLGELYLAQLAMVYWAILAMITLAEAQRVSWWRVLLALVAVVVATSLLIEIGMRM